MFEPMIGMILHNSGGIISCPWRGQCRGLIHDIGIQHTSDEDTRRDGGAMAQLGEKALQTHQGSRSRPMRVELITGLKAMPERLVALAGRLAGQRYRDVWVSWLIRA